MTDIEAADTLDEGRLTVHHDAVWLLHRNGLDSFESFYRPDLGEVLRDVGPRENVRLTLEVDGDSQRFFLKRHAPLRNLDKLLSWMRLRRPKTAARVEWENIERLRVLGIVTMRPVALGEDPDTGRSFVMTAEIAAGTPADDFAKTHFGGETNVAARRTFVRRLAERVRMLHAARLSHRDLYLCHVFVREDAGELQLHLIDLQRLGRHLFMRRWRVKDLAQLAYSQPEGTFTRTDAVRFLRSYFDAAPLSAGHKRLARAVLRKAARMRRRNVAKGACP